MELNPGTLLQDDKYRIIRSLGRGGFGITYLAEEVMAKRKVCIKEFFPNGYYKREDTLRISLLSDSFGYMSKMCDKFMKEAKTIARLDHPNIIHIFDVFKQNSTGYYVMEYIDGESLHDMVKRRGALAEDEAKAYILQLASALKYIHSKNIIHLDVKPANIMVRKSDNCAILIDFGLSLQYDYDGSMIHSRPVGISPGFTPIEQYPCGVSKFSPAMDIYSMAATLYYLVTATVPPMALDVAESGLPALPTHLSEGVRRVIERGMESRMKTRPQSVDEFLQVLEGASASAAATQIAMPNEASAATQVAQPKQVSTPKSEQQRIDNMVAQGLGRDGVYQVGDYYNRGGKQGVVFEVWNGGRNGKIVSLDRATKKWCTDSQYDKEIVTGAKSKTDGKANTDMIMHRSDCSQYLAFVWCRNKGNDWYLPAVYELLAIYKAKDKINNTMSKCGGESIRTTIGFVYWTSTESSNNDEFCAWYVGLGNGSTNYDDKNGYGYVRAVSAF